MLHLIMIIIKLLVICFSGLLLVKGQSVSFDANSCTTPDRLQGNCISLTECPNLLDGLRKFGDTEEYSEFLARYTCDTDFNSPKVCCSKLRQQIDYDRQPVYGPERKHERDNYPNILSPPYCGLSQRAEEINFRHRVVGGKPSLLGDWPWMAALIFKDRRNLQTSQRFDCGGALVTDRHVITAGHCILKTLVLVRLGDLNLDDSVIDGAAPINIQVEKTLRHPLYLISRNGNSINDIGIVYLARPVRFNDFIRPICLPKSEELKFQTFERKKAFVAGWGEISFGGPSSSELTEIEIPIYNNEDCKSIYEQLATITSSLMCAGLLEGGKDACRGDSGGPLMLPYNGSYYMIGLVSFGKKCALPGYTGVYTRITSYLDWINNNLV